MDTTLLSAYKALNEAHAAINRAQSLDEALRACLRVVLEHSVAEYGAIWYADKRQGNTLRPFFWIGPSDLTSCAHAPGDGAVGRVFSTQQSERYLMFTPQDDPATVEDFADVDVTAMICVPFSDNTDQLGCIQFVNKTGGGAFTNEEADVCEMMVMLAAVVIAEEGYLEPEWEPGEIVMRAGHHTRVR